MKNKTTHSKKGFQIRMRFDKRLSAMIEDLLKFRAEFTEDQWKKLVVGSSRKYSTMRVLNRNEKIGKVINLAMMTRFYNNCLIHRRLSPGAGPI